MSVNWTERGTDPETGFAEKSATGAVIEYALTEESAVSDPYEFVTVNFTVYFPAPEYVWEGFLLVDLPPSPKSHSHFVGLPVEVSVNWTVRGASPSSGEAVKLASGPFPSTVM
jgi:hypothetical protein